ncbi:unnamed protein product [Cuscuta campestris]|uniref:Uncharacterized protein n=1 Tax=Cuscuta campestris TaxID=132261 RepID=A0A484NR29_9ASTE|nr:unnamed protein product [Cuscuta campestris]
MEIIHPLGESDRLLNKLNAIYETGYGAPTLNSPDKCTDSVLGFASIERKPHSLQFIDRRVLGIDQERNDSLFHVVHEEVDTDEDDKMTLIQLKDKSKKHGGHDDLCGDADDTMTIGKLKSACSKKRGFSSHSDSRVIHEDVISSQLDEDDDDLKVNIGFLKPSLRKCSKAKQRRIDMYPISLPKNVTSDETEDALASGVPMQLKKESSSAEVIICEVPETVVSQHKIPMSGEEQLHCMLNEISYEHLESFEPDYSPFDCCRDLHPNNPEMSFDTETIMKSNKLDTNKTGCADLHDGEDIYMSEDEVVCANLSPNVSETVLVNDFCWISNDETCMSEDDGEEKCHANTQLGATISPFKKCISLGDSHSSSNTDKLDSFDGQQPPKFSSLDEENIPTLKCLPCESTSNDISPCSQEELCLTMNSMDLLNDLDIYRCDEKLNFGVNSESENTENPCMPSSLSIEENGTVSDELCHEKINTCPNETEGRLVIKGKGPTPDRKLEGRRRSHSRSLPHFSSGCSSVQLFSASALAFSQQQMHDIESLAGMLLFELRSIKDIVTGKLQYEGCSGESLENELDKDPNLLLLQVRTAILKANKVGRNARKQLSKMNKQCTRFCKLLEISRDGAPPNDEVHNKKRKIVFADEAGGMLCHVKYFSNESHDTNLKQPDDGKQED